MSYPDKLKVAWPTTMCFGYKRSIERHKTNAPLTSPIKYPLLMRFDVARFFSEMLMLSSLLRHGDLF